MARPISRPVHGVADYAYVAAVFAAPNLLGFEDEPRAVLLCRALSAGILVSTVLTRAEWGVVRVVPFRAHLALDMLVSVATVGAPWLLGFAHHRRARSTVVAVGLFGLGVALLSRPEELPE
ncbi:hypothetical protein HNQ07_002014 [Deinococcus metalli]|uniref:Uncharacterized protein n=1 Tax=Deinococcus metalli TaxID=1141878 RepID=A0A7W8NQ89_9DEIO|nr:hypothetical protein [Deinococcus metalli]MBB5376550.1 hypothetical protein [Deinococcus metalli]GHF43183.1 hypothetical protein GCM10017781_19510 [Deinococcus metalli]